MTFAIDGNQVEAVAATNQSTGFCPRPDCWQAVTAALDAIGLRRPEKFATAFEFRRCENCGAVNIVKNDGFVCALCDADLPRAWNFG